MLQHRQELLQQEIVVQTQSRRCQCLQSFDDRLHPLPLPLPLPLLYNNKLLLFIIMMMMMITMMDDHDDDG
jgi:hypothetical protein